MGSYRLTEEGTQWVLWELSEPSPWQPQYQFTLQPRRLADFAEMCHYQQTAPESHFTQKSLCSLPTPEGRVSLSDKRLIITRNGQREERELASPAEVESALREWFGVELE
jgi:N-hydroxyarylamine O-acetyltransferase